MKHYKVIRTYCDRLTNESVNCSAVAEGHAKVIYKVRQWVKAPVTFSNYGYHLLVFTKLQAAQDFICGLDDYEIYEAHVRGIIDLPNNGCFDVVLLSCNGILALQDTRLKFAWPDGSRMVREVKLIKRVS